MQFNKKILPSGLRLVTVPLAESNTVTVLVLTEVGSKYETKEQSGISHFLEHMAFKGTTKRPSALAITKELDGLGAQYNAFTSHEYTGYYAKAQAAQLEAVFDIVADMYLNLTVPASEVESERNVIIEEINMYEDLPHRNVQDLFMELLYGDQPAGWNIAGTIESVKGITTEALRTYHERYTAPATVIVVAGKCDQAQIDALVQKHFAGISENPITSKVKTIDTQNGPQIRIKERKTDQAHFVLGVRTFDLFDSRSATLEVLAQILGGGMSSRLFQSMRSERGLGYYVNAGKDLYTDHGYLAVSAGVTTTRVSEAIEVIMQELKKMRDTLVSEEELNRVKQMILGNMYLELEGSEELANFYGGQEVLRKPIMTPAEYEQKFRAVTAADIQTLAREIFTTNNLNLALIGPQTDVEALKKLLVI